MICGRGVVGGVAPYIETEGILLEKKHPVFCNKPCGYAVIVPYRLKIIHK